MNLRLSSWPTLSRFGLQANWIIGGGPHMRMRVSSLGGGRWSLIMTSLMKPWLYSQPVTEERSEVFTNSKEAHYDPINLLSNALLILQCETLTLLSDFMRHLLLEILPSGALSRVNHSLNLSGWFTWISSSSGRSRMSFSV